MSDRDPDDVTRRLKAILAAHLRQNKGGSDVDMDAELRDLGLDSMTAIDLLLDIERTFAISFPDSLIVSDTFRTGAALRDAILELRRA